MPKPSPTERVTQRMTQELDTQTPRLVTQLATDFNGPDRKNAPTSEWHAVIRQNWDDPQWRQAQSDRMGEVPFVHDALDAFGIPRSTLANYTPPPEHDIPPIPTMALPNPTQPIPEPTV